MGWRVLLVTTIIVLSYIPSASGVSAETASIEIVLPKHHGIVSGEQRVVANSGGAIRSVVFDWSAGDGVWRPIGVDAIGPDRWNAEWDSRPYTGPAIIRATGIGEEGRTRDRVQIRVVNRSPQVSISISPNPFSPNKDGRKDSVKIKVKPNKPSSLRVKVLNKSGHVVRRWARQSEDGDARYVRWRGRSKKHRVRDGRFRVVAIARDQLGLKDRSGKRLLVDTKPPRVRWRRVGPEPTTGAKKLTHGFVIRDRASRIRMRMLVSDDLGVLSRSRAFSRKTGRRSFSFIPRYRDGSRLLPAIYDSRLRMADDAGNVRISKPARWRVYRNVGTRTWTHVPNAGRRVALTFDDCDDPAAWQSLLSTMRTRGIKGTFFCPGRQVLSYPRLARATVRAGHTVGSHGWDHAWLSRLSTQDVAWRLKKDRRAWWRTARASSIPYFRPPYGATGPTVRAGAALTGHYRLILWDVDPSDYLDPSPWDISSRVVGRAHAGSIVVMHVRKNTAAALPSIIQGLRNKGLEPVSLHRLFRASGRR